MDSFKRETMGTIHALLGKEDDSPKTLACFAPAQEAAPKDERICHLQNENAALRRQVMWLANELGQRSYMFTADEWVEEARRMTKHGCHGV